MKITVILFLLSGFLVQLSANPNRPENSLYNVEKYGALGDGNFNSTDAIQSSIDDCAKAGGGVVYIPPGIFMSGTIELKDYVCLELSPGAELRAIPDLSAFPEITPETKSNFNIFFKRAFIFADNAKNISIRGEGTINGQGQAEAFKQTTWKVPDRYQKRPGLLRIVNCEGVNIENVKLINSGFWTLHLMASRDITVSGITLHSRTANYNNDGIDVDGCEDVRISDCLINSLDDAISIKATGNHPTKRVAIDNCILSSHCNAIRVGAENFAGFEDIHFSDCQIFNSRNGITLQNIDGFKMKRIIFRGIMLRQVGIPIYVITGRKSYNIGVPENEFPCPPNENPASVEDLIFSDISGINIGYYHGASYNNVMVEKNYRDAMILSGHPQAPLIRCKMNDINFHFNGKGTKEDCRIQLPNVNNRPNPSFEATPVYGLLIRNARGLNLNHINLNFEENDERDAIGLENCGQVFLTGAVIQSAQGAQSVIFDKRTKLEVACSFQMVGEDVDEISTLNGNINSSEKSFFKPE